MPSPSPPNPPSFRQPQRAVLLGLCGSLVPEHEVGEWVVYRNCLDLTALELPDPAINSPVAEPMVLGCAPDLTGRIQQQLGLTTAVTAVTSRRLIFLAQEKQLLAQRYQAQVVDMEGSVALRELTGRGIELAMVRVVSDGCDQNLPDLSPGFSPEGTLRPLPLAMAMGRRPQAALRLIRGSLRGLQHLEKMTVRLLSQVPAPPV